MYAIQMASSGMIYTTKFHEDWYRSSRNIKILLRRFEGLLLMEGIYKLKP
jgi:hypothetical protein